MEIVSDDDKNKPLFDTASQPTDQAILVLNTKPFEAKPFVFDLNGKP